MRFVQLLGVVAALALGVVAPARADVIYSLSQTSATPAGSVFASGFVVVTDQAYRDGFSLRSVFNGPSSVTGFAPTGSLAGLVAMQIDIVAAGVTNFGGPFTKETFELGGLTERFDFSLSAPPSGALTGRIDWRIDVHQIGVTFANGGFSGFGATEFFNTPCNQNPTYCRFAGTVSVTTVPEPATLALFGVALAGLGLVARRRG